MRNRHTHAFTLLELMIVVAIIGIIAAVGIPTLSKYVRRSRTVEAVTSIKKIWDGAYAYYMDEHSDRAGGVLRKEFPRHTGCGPSTGMSCCLEVPSTVPAGTKIKTRPSDWASSMCWAALGFELNDPQYYQYQYRKSGFDVDSQFTARARGDLNGNGVYSTFEMVGYVDDNGAVRKGAGIYKYLPLE